MEQTFSPHEGIVLSLRGNKLKTSGRNGKEQCYTVSKETQVTVDGIIGTEMDLQAGTPVRIKLHRVYQDLATFIEITDSIKNT